MMIKLDDFIPIFPAPIEIIRIHSKTDIIFHDPTYAWNRILTIIGKFEENYYLCKQRCPKCWNHIFRKDRDIDTRFYCEKCNYAVEAMDKIVFKDKIG